LNPGENAQLSSIDAGSARYPQNSLLIPCSKAKFADFGQNSQLLGASSKNFLLFSLFFGFLRISVAFHLQSLERAASSTAHILHLLQQLLQFRLKDVRVLEADDFLAEHALAIIEQRGGQAFQGTEFLHQFIGRDH
jgi:hypothetical protein